MNILFLLIGLQALAASARFTVAPMTSTVDGDVQPAVTRVRRQDVPQPTITSVACPECSIFGFAWATTWPPLLGTSYSKCVISSDWGTCTWPDSGDGWPAGHRLAPEQCICSKYGVCGPRSDPIEWLSFSEWLVKRCTMYGFGFTPPLYVYWPPCAERCTKSMVASNVGGIRDCLHSASPFPLNPCACKYFTSCSTDCRQGEESSSFDRWKKYVCEMKYTDIGSSTAQTAYNYLDTLPGCVESYCSSVISNYQVTGEVRFSHCVDKLGTSFFNRWFETDPATRSQWDTLNSKCVCSVLTEAYSYTGCSNGEGALWLTNQVGEVCGWGRLNTTYPYTIHPLGFPTDPVGFLASIAENTPPSCATPISTQCPDVLAAAQKCWNASEPTNCFCPIAANISCPVCLKGRESRDYLALMIGACEDAPISVTATQNGSMISANVTGAFEDNWVDAAQLKRQAHLNLLPWTLPVHYRAEDDHSEQAGKREPACPSNFSKIFAFTIVNAVSFAVTVFIGRRTVVRKLTRGRLGKPGGSPLWVLTALFFTFLTIMANFINAVIIKHTPGFAAVNVGGLVLLWCSRPRIAWVAALLVQLQKEQEMYFTTGASALISEVVLQAMGAVYLGKTANFAIRTHSLKPPKPPIGLVPGETAAFLMYVGAVIWLASVGVALMQFVWTFMGLKQLVYAGIAWVRGRPNEAKALIKSRTWQHISIRTAPMLPEFIAVTRKVAGSLGAQSQRPRGMLEGIHVPPGPLASRVSNLEVIHQPLSPSTTIYNKQDHQIQVGMVSASPGWVTALKRMGLNEKALGNISFVVMWMVLPFIGQWLFWAGYIHLAGEMYCPPNLKALVVVWSGASAIGIFFNAAV